MRLRNKRKTVYTFSMLLAVVCVIISFACFILRVPSITYKNNDIELFAAELVLPDSDTLKTFDNSQSPKKILAKSVKNSNNDDDNNEVTIDEESDHSGENTYKIIESQVGASGINYENFYVKKAVDYNLEIAKELSLKPDINIVKDNSPRVLIVHTHTCESYMDKDQGFFYESFYPRTKDQRKSVVAVGDAIAERIKSSNIGVIHDTTYHDDPTYNGSYTRAADTIRKNLSENPSIQVVIDIHRDSLGNNESGKIKPTFRVNGRKAAQIMVISGCDLNGELGFPDWEYNLRLALRIQREAENMYPGMTRPMYFGEVKYNMNITHGSVLIEVGTDVNTLDEAIYSGSLLGDVLSKVLSDLT